MKVTQIKEMNTCRKEHMMHGQKATTIEISIWYIGEKRGPL